MLKSSHGTQHMMHYKRVVAPKGVERKLSLHPAPRIAIRVNPQACKLELWLRKVSHRGQRPPLQEQNLIPLR